MTRSGQTRPVSLAMNMIFIRKHFTLPLCVLMSMYEISLQGATEREGGRGRTKKTKKVALEMELLLVGLMIVV